jgi:hypothetical protein
MNKRIEQLAGQLGPVATVGDWGRVEWADNVYPQRGDKMYAAVDLAKFAELIVRECVIRAEREWIRNGSGTEHNQAVSKIIESIKEHFGVSE